jgi:aminomethyltransferase
MTRSALHDRHAELGARFVDFGGWEMPVQYESVLNEHKAVREAVGVFDVSHLGRFSFRGSAALRGLSMSLSNDPARLSPLRTQYTMALNADGGVIDDIILWRWSDEEFWVIPNAGNAARVEAICSGAAPDALVEDLRPSTVALAVAGPEAPALLESVLGVAPRRSHLAPTMFDGHRAWLAGTGYTGERGGEVVIDHAGAASLLDRLVSAGAKPCGLGARDTLRLEAALPLWGQDLDETITPLEARLDFAVSFTHEFTGRTGLELQLEQGVPQHRILFATEGRAIPRHGHALRSGERRGTVSSGNFGPTVGHGIGMGYLDGAPSDEITTVEVEIRGEWHPARVVSSFLA